MQSHKSVLLAVLASTLLAGTSLNAADRIRPSIERPVIEDLRPTRLDRCLFMPDLVVTYLGVTWNNSNHQASVTVKNIGKKAAGPFMLYVTPDENPVSNNHRPQQRYDIRGLRPGEARSISANFNTQAHPDNNMLRNVYRVTAHADPKDQVRECRENNNKRTTYLITASP
ncbi:MAG: CARDB domain-containing protein [Thiolinea sp.]